MKDVFIVLTCTGTILSYIIKYHTGNKYTHISIGLDKDLKELYSFGRINPYIAFAGGFVKEGINFGTFKRFKNTMSQVYSIQVTDEQYEKIVKTIGIFEKEKQKYKFNVLGLFLATFQKRRVRKNTFYCAEFVKYVLKKGKINVTELPKIIKPEDFVALKDLHPVYQGYFREYKYASRNLQNVLT